MNQLLILGPSASSAVKTALAANVHSPLSNAGSLFAHVHRLL